MGIGSIHRMPPRFIVIVVASNTGEGQCQMYTNITFKAAKFETCPSGQSPQSQHIFLALPVLLGDLGQVVLPRL